MQVKNRGNETGTKSCRNALPFWGCLPSATCQLLDAALTHSSYANENKNRHVHFNERLEFLGDAILDLVIGEYLFMHYPHMPEGELSKARASVVSEMPLASVFGSYHIGDYMLMGQNSSPAAGRRPASWLMPSKPSSEPCTSITPMVLPVRLSFIT